MLTSQHVLIDWQEAMAAYFQTPRPLFSKELAAFIQLVILDNAIQTQAHPFKLAVDWDRLPPNDDRWWGMFWTVMKDLLYAGNVPDEYEKTCRKMRQLLDGRWQHFRERFAAVHLGWMEKNIEALNGEIRYLHGLLGIPEGQPKPEPSVPATLQLTRQLRHRVFLLEMPFWKRRRERKRLKLMDKKRYEQLARTPPMTPDQREKLKEKYGITGDRPVSFAEQFAEGGPDGAS